MQTVGYEYKDANRRWWRAQAFKKSGKKNANFDCKWDCFFWLVNERGGEDTLIWSGPLWANENSAPLAAEIMAAYLADAATLATKMAYHCK